MSDNYAHPDSFGGMDVNFNCGQGDGYKGLESAYDAPTKEPFIARMPPAPARDNGVIKTFATGAIRSSDEGKNAYEGFLSMEALEEFGDYMTRHRKLPDGSLRDPDNWKKGMGLDSFIGSLLRHTFELVALHTRGYVTRRIRREMPDKVSDLDFLKREIACAILFNVQGYLHEYLAGPRPASGSELTATQLLERIHRRFEDERLT